MKLCSAHHFTVAATFPARKEIPLSIPEFSFTYFSHWEEVPEEYWRLAEASGDYFLQKNYLALLEDCPSAGMKFGYILFRNRGQGIGIAYYQRLEFRAKDHIRAEETAHREFKDLVASHLNLHLLVCGNILLTGQHAYFFQLQDVQVTGQLLREALRKIALNTRRLGQKLDVIMLKDLEEQQAETILDWQQYNYQHLSFQPNMVMPIPTAWQGIDDYLEALTSKYRVRYRRARKKLTGISCHELNDRQILSFEKELYALYRNVADSSEFCMAYLHSHYFSELKTRNPEGFRLWAYFKKDRIIGFCTSLLNGDQLEAHFLGLDKSENTDSQLYLNMLYDLVEAAITAKVSRLIFSRTALAIKSSVGAVSAPASVLLNYPFSPVLNCLTPYLVRLLEPKTDWEARHPFRDRLPEEILDK